MNLKSCLRPRSRGRASERGDAGNNNNERVASRSRYQSAHDITKSNSILLNKSDGTWTTESSQPTACCEAPNVYCRSPLATKSKLKLSNGQVIEFPVGGGSCSQSEVTFDQQSRPTFRDRHYDEEDLRGGSLMSPAASSHSGFSIPGDRRSMGGRGGPRAIVNTSRASNHPSTLALMSERDALSIASGSTKSDAFMYERDRQDIVQSNRVPPQMLLALDDGSHQYHRQKVSSVDSPKRNWTQEEGVNPISRKSSYESHRSFLSDISKHTTGGSSKGRGRAYQTAADFGISVKSLEELSAQSESVGILVGKQNEPSPRTVAIEHQSLNGFVFEDGMTSSGAVGADRSPGSSVYWNKRVTNATVRFGPNHPFTAEAWSDLGLAQLHSHAFPGALHSFKKAVAIYRTKPNLKLALAKALHQLGNVYHVSELSKDDNKKSMRCLGESLQIRFEKLGSLHPDTVGTLNYMASVYASLQKFQEAREAYLEVLAVREAIFGAFHPSVAVASHELANTAHRLGDLDEATLYYCKALDIYEAYELSEDHPSLARLLTDMQHMQGLRET